MGTATVPGGGCPPHYLSALHADGSRFGLSSSEAAAANSALAKLSIQPTLGAGVPGLAVGGTDTFAGGVAGASRFLPGFQADTVSSGAATHIASGLSLSATPLAASGPTAAALKGAELASAGAPKLIVLHDQSTIKLIGVSGHTLPKG